MFLLVAAKLSLEEFYSPHLPAGKQDGGQSIFRHPERMDRKELLVISSLILYLFMQISLIFSS